MEGTGVVQRMAEVGLDDHDGGEQRAGPCSGIEVSCFSHLFRVTATMTLSPRSRIPAK